MIFTDSHGGEHELPDGVAPERRMAGYAVVEHDGKYLMVQSGSGRWVFPGGGIEPDESVEDGTKRECLEETGYSIDVIENPMYQREQAFYHTREERYYLSTQEFHRAKLVSDEPNLDAIADGDKGRRVEWVSLDIADDDFHPTVRELVEQLRGET